MGQITCNVIEDLLPLYQEDMLSGDSKQLVEEHIQHCEACRKKMSDMKHALILPREKDASPILSLKKRLFKKKIMLIAITTFVVMAIVILFLVYVRSPIPIVYSEELVKAEEMDSGAVVVTLSSDIDGYIISEGDTSENSLEGCNYDITVWNTLWNKYFNSGKTQSIIINEKVKSIYFYYADTDEAEAVENVLVYGTPMNGGFVVLPRHVLTIYFVLMLMLFLLIGVIRIGVRKWKRASRVIEVIWLIPLAYMISHFLVKGMHPLESSILVSHDFSGILLLMIPIFGILYGGRWFILHRKARVS